MSGRKPTALITNDDSIDSPFLELAIRSLENFCDIIVAVPATEHSWKGKSMTRHGVLKVKEVKVADNKGWAIDGTPADCVNLAIHNLVPKRPDLIVSGINIGKNVGLGFSLASGTIGACLEANIAGIPAIALSQELLPSDFLYWDKNRRFSKETEDIVGETIPASCRLIWETIERKKSVLPITWNINFPYKSNSEPEIVFTKLSHTFYDKCFTKQGDHYRFGLATAKVDSRPGTDVAALKEGKISVTLIDITTFGQKIPSVD